MGGGYSDPDPDGWLVGAYAGYSYQFDNNLVLGAEIDFVRSNAGGDSNFYDPSGNSTGPEFISRLDMKWEGAVRARLGYAIDRWLPYVAGGVAFARVEWADFASGNMYESRDITYTGWTLGAGTEHAFTPNLVGRVEYRFSDFGSESFTDRDGDDTSVDLTTHDIRFGIAYKF